MVKRGNKAKFDQIPYTIPSTILSGIPSGIINNDGNIQLVSFDPPPPKWPVSSVLYDSHDSFIVHIILIAVAYLHIHYHVSFRACSALLSCLNSIMLFAGIFPLHDPSKHIPSNFATIIKRLNLEDHFSIFPVCSSCHMLFQCNIASSSWCPRCMCALFNSANRQLFCSLTTRKAPRALPICATSLWTLSSLLEDFFLQGGIGDAVEDWQM